MPQRYEIITTQSGQTVLARVSNGVTAKVIMPGDPIVSTEQFKATPAEFASLMAKTRTHTFRLNPKTRRINATKRRGPSSSGTPTA